MLVSCHPSLPTLWQPPWVYPLLAISSQYGAQQETVGHFSSLSKCPVTVRNCFREGIAKPQWRIHKVAIPGPILFLKGKRQQQKRKVPFFFFFADFLLLSRIPQGMCAVDSAVVAVLRAPNQGRAFNSLGHSEHRGPGGFRDMKH